MTDLSQKDSELENFTPLVVDLFKNSRLKKGYSIDEIATYLRISAAYIEAIEQANIVDFPERVYVLGFVQSYAKFLELNPSECVDRFKIEVLNEIKSSDPLSFPVPLSIDSSPNKKLIIFSSATLLILLIIGYVIWHWGTRTVQEDINLKKYTDFSSSDLKDNASSKLSEKNNLNDSSSSLALLKSDVQEDKAKNLMPELDKDSKDISKQSDSVGLSLSAPSAEPTNTMINFEFIQPTWIQIKNLTGQVILEKIFQPGEFYNLKGNSGYHLHTGNAGGIKIRTDHSTFKILGKSGEVLSHLSLDFSTLSQYLESH